jgi:hypothetical protein
MEAREEVAGLQRLAALHHTSHLAASERERNPKSVQGM